MFYGLLHKLHRLVVRATVTAVAAAFPVFAQVSFGAMDLNSDNALLFSVRQSVPGSPAYSSLFLTHLGKSAIEESPEILTCFPERMELLLDGSCLQVRNRYGTAWYSTVDRQLSWISSANRIPVEYTRTGPACASPDGKWLCFVRQTKSSVGQLILQNVKTSEQHVLIEAVDFSYTSVPVKWSPDSNVLLYEKNGMLYFASPADMFKRVQLSEEYRRIGKGSINSVSWSGGPSFLYIDGDIVYRVRENELYTRGLYAALVGNGTIVGRLPVLFDAANDRFWCDVDESHMVVISDDKIVSFYTIMEHGYDFVKINGIYPLTGIKGSPLGYNVFWTSSHEPMLWLDVLSYDTGHKAGSVYALSDNMSSVLEVKDSIGAKLSPDRRHVAFTGESSLHVYNVTSWKPVARLSGEQISSFVWASPNSLYVGGNKTVRLWRFDAAAQDGRPSAGTARVLFLSSSLDFCWDGGRIISYDEDSQSVYMYDNRRHTWNDVPKWQRRSFERNEKNGRFRVFIGDAQNKRYGNAIFVRSLSGTVLTYPLYEETDMPVSSPKRASIVFDAMDSAEGLSRIIAVLDEFGLKGTFFLNGEFIRRYPLETRQLVMAGHTCASSFFSTADLTGGDWVIDSDFIKRGLARNEDEFFAATGKELALLWHAPWYHVTPLMREAGAQAGYRYVDAFDAEQVRNMRSGVSGDLIDAFVATLKDGITISVSTGQSKNKNEDRLYEKLDLLIAAVLDSGYTLAPVQDYAER